MGDWDPRTYPTFIREEVPAYDTLQDEVVRAAAGLAARRILDLGIGSGETARRLLDAHPEATLVGIDSSPEMLAEARRTLPPDRSTLLLARLEDPLPSGPFDLVASVLAVHHLQGEAKADLFRRVARVLRAGGLLALGDVVVPERPDDAVVPIEAGYDFPSPVRDQLAWLAAAGLRGTVTWRAGDLAVLRAAAPQPHSPM